MDQATRNLVQRATQDARRLLETEFAAQLEGTFDILPDGTILPDPGAHLDDRQRLVRRKIIEVIDHIRQKDAGKTTAQAVDDYLREAAFTFLNRFAALKVLESRGLVQQCVSRGDQSNGFKEFGGLAPGLGSLPDKGYQLYLECLFDELATDVKVLFNRRDAASLLWPRRQALIDLLKILNHEALHGVWAEDEAIGWIYQYYNGDDASAMRKAVNGGAPRNSRELAVRNQFFTPRYVVEFLVDNTLGRLWYEMRQGQTSLKDSCRYLVRRPTEIFLKPGETAPESTDGSDPQAEENLSQEELLRQPVHIPHRPLKDPREIRLLDPACGSMHFGLYAFDLFTVIYDEAWEIAHGPDDAVRSAETFAPFVAFAAYFPDKAAFLCEVPRLIIEHNIHGIDIDPRAAQIAGLSLWLRAQRAWQQAGVKPADRPRITRSNLVCAEPMPGEKELLREFIGQQFPAGERPAFAFLLETVFDRMTLAGEAGSLLRIEEEIRAAIAEAKRLWKSGPKHEQATLFPEAGARPGQGEMRVDLSGITDEQFWERAEQRIYDALEAYAEQAENGGGFQRRLFADDAAQGFAFIDLCRKRYDVVVMNPPFGLPSLPSREYSANEYAHSKEDMDAGMVRRGAEVLTTNGLLGAIFNRTQWFKPTLRAWRENVLFDLCSVEVGADLGYGVLDGALVEAATYVLERGVTNSTGTFFRALKEVDKQSALLSGVHAVQVGDVHAKDIFSVASTTFQRLPELRLSYWITPSLQRAFREFPPLDPGAASVKSGLNTGEDFRFMRLLWEVSPADLFAGVAVQSTATPSKTWVPIAKGGEYSPYFADIHLCLPWDQEGYELRQFPKSYLRNRDCYFRAGITYSVRTTSNFSPRMLPPGGIFGHKGNLIFAASDAENSALCALLMSRVVASIIELSMFSGDAVSSGSAARSYEAGILQAIPIPRYSEGIRDDLGAALSEIWRNKQVTDSKEETSRYFIPRSWGDTKDIATSADEELEGYEDRCLAIIRMSADIETLSRRLYELDAVAIKELNEEFGVHPETLPRCKVVNSSVFDRSYLAPTEDVINEEVEDSGGSRAVTKKTYFADRKLELLAHTLTVHPSIIVDTRRERRLIVQADVTKVCVDVLSQALGFVFGRWDIRYATGERPAPELPDPFAPLPVCPPGMLQGDDGLPLSPEAGRRLRTEGRYPLDVAWDGILVDDPEHPLDLERRVHAALAVLWGDRADALEHEACALLGVPTLREWFRRPTGFFADHLKRYSKSRRQAPIYWPLSTASGSYTLWLYYHRFRRDTLALALEHANEKLRYERRKLEALRQDAGLNPTRNQRDAIDVQEVFVSQISGLVEELSRVAPLWNPDLNDGVIINYAPLWRMIGHSAWRKSVKECWDSLVAGEYDWAHLAMHLWPERVVPKCQTDASLAIAHGLDHVFWEKDDRDRLVKKSPPEGGWEPVIQKLIAERTSPAVKAALDSLLTAPPLAGTGGGRRGSRRAATQRRTQIVNGADTPAAVENPPARSRTRATAVPDDETLNTIMAAIATLPDGASKAEILTATGLTDGRWNSAINALLERGVVTRTGERRGTRYRLAPREGQT